MTSIERTLAEALSKSGMLWIQLSDRAWPVWFAAAGGTAYVLSGRGEQPLPDLPERVTLILRAKDSRARLLTVAATTQRVTPEHPDWAAATAALQAGRLNSPVPHGELPVHWAARAVITALTPDPHAARMGADGEEPSGAAPPAPTGATTR